MMLLVQIILVVIATIRQRTLSPIFAAGVIFALSFATGYFMGLTPDTVRIGFMADYILIGVTLYYIFTKPS